MQRIHLLIFIKQFSPEMTSYLVYSLESYMKAGKLLEIYFFRKGTGIKPITGFIKSVGKVLTWSNPTASFLIFVVSIVFDSI